MEAAAIRARRYAERQACGGLDRVAVLSLDAPMYGPAESMTGGAALYNAQPFSRVRSGAGRFIVDKHSEMREIKESGFAAFLV